MYVHSGDGCLSLRLAFNSFSEAVASERTPPLFTFHRKGVTLKSRGFALMTVLIVVIIVPIVVFGITAFISSSVSRYDAQTRSLKALYLAQAGIHRAIYNIKSAGAPLPVSNWDANNQIAVTLVAQCSNVYQLKSIGTSVATSNSVSRSVFAQYDSTSNKVQIYIEGDGAGIPAPVCCDDVWWPFTEGSGNTTGTAPFQGTRTGTAPNETLPAWTASGRIGNALSFNQGNATNNYVAVPDSAGLDLATSGTIMAWIYNTLQVTTEAGIVQKGTLANHSDETYGLNIIRSGQNRRLEFTLYDNTNTANDNTITTGVLTFDTNLSLNTWYHVAGSWSNTAQGMRVYLNGEEKAFNATPRTARTNNAALLIGTRAKNSKTTRFIGTIDEVHVYACQKTALEIKAYYNSTCSPQPGCQT